MNRWHHAQLAHLLGRLKELKDADGTSVLDRSMIVYGSSLADGHEHKEKDLPVLLAGGGAGSLNPGRYLDFKEDTSMSALHLGLLQRMGVKIDSFADSSTPLANI